MSVNNVLAIESAFEILRSEEGDEVSHFVQALTMWQPLTFPITATASLDLPVPAISSTSLAMAGRGRNPLIFSLSTSGWCNVDKRLAANVDHPPDYSSPTQLGRLLAVPGILDKTCSTSHRSERQRTSADLLACGQHARGCDRSYQSNRHLEQDQGCK